METILSTINWSEYPKSPQAHEVIREFLDRELRPGASFSVRDEFPSLYGPVPGGHSLVIESGKEIAAHVGYLVREFRHPEFRFKLGLIGSVITARHFREQGLATRLLTQACANLERLGASLAILWSDKVDFYAGLGFHRAGRECDLRFSAGLPATGIPPVAYVASRHFDGLWKCYQRHAGGLDRTREEFAKLCAIPHSRIFVTEQGGQVTSYLVVQKGADFENYIHEWGGDPEELGRNVAWVQNRDFRDAELTLISPPFYSNDSLKKMARLQWDGVLGLMKILNQQALWNVYSGYLKARSLTTDWNRETGRVRIGQDSFPCQNDQQMLRLIFGEAVPPRQPVLPFFLWGFDSV